MDQLCCCCANRALTTKDQNRRHDVRNQHRQVLQHGPAVEAVQVLVMPAVTEWMILMMKMMTLDLSTWT